MKKEIAKDAIKLMVEAYKAGVMDVIEGKITSDLDINEYVQERFKKILNEEISKRNAVERVKP